MLVEGDKDSYGALTTTSNLRGKNAMTSVYYYSRAFKGARYLLIIHELLVAVGFFPAGVQDETLKESQRLAS